MARNYNQSDPVGSSSSMINGKTGLPSFGGILDDMLNTFIFGDAGFSSDLWDELSGKNSQMREFEQQEYLMDKQNEYNSPENQMARMRAAGINPNTAAAGIAGAGSTSAQPQAVSNNTAGASNALSSVAGALGSLGGAANDFANANRTNELVDFEKRRMSAETTLALENAGLSHWQSVSISEMLPYLTANQRADFYLKLANIDETRARYDNLVAEHKNIIAHYDEIIANVGLMYSEQQVNEAQEGKIKEETRFIKADNDFWDSEGYLRNQPSDVALRNCVVKGKTENANKIGEAIETSQQKAASGQFKAEEAYAYNISYLREQGKDVAESLYGDIKTLPQFGSRLVNHTMKLIDENIMPLIGQGKIKEARKEITEVLNNCYVGLEEHPEDAAHYNKYIKLCTDMLSANNEEFKRLYELWQSGNAE